MAAGAARRAASAEQVRAHAGIPVWDYEHRSQEAVDRLAAWIRSGNLRYREEILDGLEQAPDAIAGLYRGENLGKRLIRVDHL